MPTSWARRRPARQSPAAKVHDVDRKVIACRERKRLDRVKRGECRRVEATRPDGGAGGPGTQRTPRTPTRAHLPLLPSGPGGVRRDDAARGVCTHPSPGRRRARNPLHRAPRRAPDHRLPGGDSAGAPPSGILVALLSVHIRASPTVARRIRLVAYGARLESVLGESPRGFESPILRRPKGPPHSRRALRRRAGAHRKGPSHRCDGPLDVPTVRRAGTWRRRCRRRLPPAYGCPARNGRGGAPRSPGSSPHPPTLGAPWTPGQALNVCLVY